MTSRQTLIVGTRGSRLALRQTELVVQSLRTHHPELQFQVREVRTEGDRRAQDSLSSIGGQGVFVKELEAALLRREVDLAVHSLKDVPTELTPGLTLAAIPERADPRDALVSRDGATLATLPDGARVGTGSARRAVQIRALRPELTPVDIRGNVDTRIRKADEGEVDAVVLAAAGLERLGLLERAAELLSTDAMLPAVGQGALAIEARADDTQLLDLLAAIDHRETRLACEAERAFLGRLGGGCRLPFGALAVVEGETIRARGFISDMEGARSFRAEVSGPAAEAEPIGVRLAEALLAQGASAFVEAVEAP
ncbi:MAG: hydroxymethylbilane synthase [Chloroflexi bacterium]|nr:hydroxymethylbilane synthase [Chloroflexota bacterium]